MAEVVVFPDCCGLIIVNKFLGGHPGADPDSCIKPTALKTFLTKQEQEYYGKRAGLLATLSEPQNDLVGDIFLSRKWKPVLDGTMNPRTGRRLYLYFRDLNPTEARKKRIFGK